MLGLLIQLIIFIGLKITAALCLATSFVHYFREPRKCPAINNEILLLPASTLAEKIRKAELTSETVVLAYIAHIKTVNPMINAVVEDRFDSAINDAKKVDQMIAHTKLTVEELKKKYPLLGVPLTVKESIAVEGLSHCAGKVLPGGKKAKKDAPTVRLCKEAGAIPLLVSNTPELCVNFESYNKVTGTTNNPYDIRRTSGGSSGGEAALLGSGASVIGLGSDIFGSVRLPAHYCGVWGHKPSSNSVSTDGHYPDSKDQTNWKQIFTLGPMCRYAVDLRLVLDVIVNEDVRPLLQLHKEIPLPHIKIYYLENDGGALLTNAIDEEIIFGMRKILSHIKNKYECKVKKLPMNIFKYSAELSYLRISAVDDIEVVSNGEGSFIEFLKYITQTSDSVFPVILIGILKYLSEFLPKSTIPHCKDILNRMKTKLCETLGEDGVLLYPCHPTPAHIHGQMYGRIFDYSYMGIFNCLELPVTNCPLGLNSEGLPFGIQVIAGHNNDTLTLTVAQEIERTFGGWIPPSRSNSNNTVL